MTSGAPSLASTPAPWWRRGVVYQVYVRSFADSNGDGTGDVVGLQSRLPYLAELGVDAIWINPWYRSPLADGGYDVADYRQIEPRYGTIEEAGELIRAAHDVDIKVIVDVVPNHTSIEHEWFVQALAAPPGDVARDRYHILPGKGPNGEEPPTDWTSVFGGPAWSRLPDGEWYLHLFDSSQPDLNWENDEVRTEFLDVLTFWLDRGADGFRVDVAHGLVKDMSWPDIEASTGALLAAAQTEGHPFWDRDGVHEIIRTWRTLLDSYDDRMMVAEAWVNGPERLARYLRPDEYHQSFNFDFLGADWNADDFRRIISESLDQAGAVGSTPTWVLSNHDVVRHPTRYGLPNGTDWRQWLLDGPHDILDPELGATRGRAASLLMLALPGSTYLYMGDELGLPEVWDLPTEVLDDPVWERSGHTAKGRDGCRVPLPWTPDGPSFGFGDGPGWLPQPELFGPLSAAQQAGDEHSTLLLHRAALRIRSSQLVQDEAFEWVEAPNGVIAFRRGSGLQSWTNLSGADVSLPTDCSIVLSSNPSQRDGGIDENIIADNSTVWLSV